MPDAERPLAGGLANAGKVVRVGDTVRRPPTPHDDAVRALLAHLEHVGFAGAPRWIGVDELGRSVLSYVEGDVAVPPFPAWSASDDLLASVAELQRAFHDAVRSFVPPDDVTWNRALADDVGAIVGHNDLCVENVVCRAGRAVAFIDFDFAAPADPLWDVTIALRHWVPFRDRVDLEAAWAGVDRVARFGAYCDAYGVTSDDRARLVTLGLRFLDGALEQMRARAKAGLPGYVEAWRDGYAAQNRRSHAWLTAAAASLTSG